MNRPPEKCPVSIVTACMKPDGTPTFTHHTVGVTQAEKADGLHFDLVEMQLFKHGFEEPFVHFPEEESPAFLHPSVRQSLGFKPHVNDTVLHLLAEGQ